MPSSLAFCAHSRSSLLVLTVGTMGVWVFVVPLGLSEKMMFTVVFSLNV